ncbi:MAG TPA: glycosyltransferase [Candidatus Pacearchaeota archaeon]|nr:glycosyltransferase [Candidatus Pacearchaeota archaeon]HPR79646.1 glycosyltransferase [Candidatus Pacearchaeota archaeon]
MKVAINITREPLGGITSVNLNLLNYLHGSNISFLGIELNAFRKFKSPKVYRHLSPNWFDHQIISICDFSINEITKNANSLKDVEEKFKSIIEIVRDILRKEKPDIFLINGTYYIPWILSIAARKEGIPIILWYAGVLAKETAHFKQNQRNIFLEMEKNIIKNSSSIIFPSQICKDLVLNEISNFKKVKDGCVIPNPISPVFTKEKKQSKSRTNKIVFIGRDAPIKNIEAFISLHLLLKRKGWKHEATIVNGKEYKAIKNMPSDIKIVPMMSNGEMSSFYQKQGLVISPSHFETFGNVPVETACTGTPVLVNKNMGCSEVFYRAGLEEMVVDFDDLELVANKTINFCGKKLESSKVKNLKNLVDCENVSQKIIKILKDFSKK